MRRGGEEMRRGGEEGFLFYPSLPFPCLHLFHYLCVSIIVCLPHYVGLHLSPSSLSISLRPPVHRFSLLLRRYYLQPSTSPYISSSLWLHPLLQLSGITSFLPLSCPLIFPTWPLSLPPAFPTIIWVLVSWHVSLSVITSLPCYYYRYVILSLSWCHYIYLSVFPLLSR